MAPAEPQRPRPRPKPRKAQKPAEPSSSTVVSPSNPTQRQLEVEDEDKLFMRNTERTTKAWKTLEEISKDTRITRPASDSSDEEVVIGHTSPRHRKHKKPKPALVARWDKDIIRLLSEDLSDDEIQVTESTPGSGRPSTNPTKRKRVERSRSQSITPPPQLPLHQIQNARNLVRQTLDTAPRPASPTHFEFDADDSTDTIILDPELQKIAQAVTSQSSLLSVAGASGSSQNLQAQAQTGGNASMAGAPEDVVLKIRWRPHPLNEAGKPQLWAFKMLRHSNFRELFEETADLAHILSDSLIMSYNGKRIFSSATPNTLKIWSEAEFEACDKTTYEYVRTHKHDPGRSQSVDVDSDFEQEARGPSRTGSLSPTRSQSSLAGSDAEGGGGKFKLILRSAVTTKNITLTVLPTTTCGAIVNAFLKAAGLTNAKTKGTPALSLDGDRLANDDEIGNADLEDGDMVEVVGL